MFLYKSNNNVKNLINIMDIYIHIGSVKTGSSFIQRILHLNSSFFLDNGIYYPELCYSDRWANGSLLREKGSVAALKDEISRIDPRAIIISDEGLFSDFKNATPDFFEIHNIRFIAYIRNPYDLIPAWTSEMLKPYNLLLRNENKLNDYTDINSLLIENSERYLYEFYGFLDSVDAVGAENVTVIPYEKNKMSAARFAKEFFKIVGIDRINQPKGYRLAGLNDRVNVTPTKKFCEMSLYLFKSMSQRDILYNYTDDLVSSIYREASGGDGPPLSEVSSGVLSRFDIEFKAAERELEKRFSWKPRWKSQKKIVTDRNTSCYDLNYSEIDRILLKKISIINLSRITENGYNVQNFVSDAEYLDMMRHALIKLRNHEIEISNQIFEFLQMSNINT